MPSIPVIPCDSDVFQKQDDLDNVKKLLEAHKDSPVVILDIDSPGGDVDMLQDLLSFLETLPCRKVLRVQQFAASCAAMLTVSYPDLILYRDAYILFHPVSEPGSDGLEYQEIPAGPPSADTSDEGKKGLKELMIPMLNSLTFLTQEEKDSILLGDAITFLGNNLAARLVKTGKYRIWDDKSVFQLLDSKLPIDPVQHYELLPL